jgi:hypothetical protein
MNDAIIVKIVDDLGALAWSEAVLFDLREVLGRACDVLEYYGDSGFELVVEYL